MIARHEAPAFDPDMVLVDFIVDDFSRGVFTIGGPDFVDADNPRQELQAIITDRVWWNLRPQLLLTTIGRYFEIHPTLSRTIQGLFGKKTRPRLDADEAIEKSVEASRAIIRLFGCVIFFRHPSYHEMKVGSDDYEYVDGIANKRVSWKGAMDAFQKAMDNAEVVDLMKPMMQKADTMGIDELFLLPHDPHNSDLALFYYAEYVKSYLVARGVDC